LAATVASAGSVCICDFLTACKLIMALLQFNVQIRKHTMKTRFSCTRYLLHWPIGKLVNWGQSFLSKALLVTCEVAMEYMLALTYSPQVKHQA